MRKNALLVAIAVIVVGLVVLAIMVKKRETLKEASVCKIGVILPLSGDGAAYGKKERDGIALAVEETNAALAATGRKIEAIYEDSKGLPAPAASAIQKLINIDKVPVVIGDAFSSPTLAMVPIADRNKVVIVSPSASSPKLSGASRYFFRVWPSDMAEASIMAEVAIKKLGFNSFAVLYGNNEYGLGLKDVFSAKVKEMGKKVLAVEAYNEGDMDFRAQLAKIKDVAPEAIYLGGYYKEFAKILKQAKELGIDAG